MATLQATTVAGALTPNQDNTRDLGSSSLKWANIYTGDLHLANAYGDWTIVEGEENLYIYNNKTNKSFKFNLIEVDPAEMPPKNTRQPGP